MSNIKVHDKIFEPYIGEEQIQQTIQRLTTEVAKDLEDTKPLFVAVLNGSFIFAADFIRKYPSDCEITFVKLSSYEGTSSTSKVYKLIGLDIPVEGRDVVVLEDIVDTGNTLEG